jgi:hypothetical protein
MSSIHQRLQKLEGNRDDLGKLLPVEESWFELDPETGKPVGPPPGTDPRAVRTYEQCLEMDRRTFPDPPRVKRVRLKETQDDGQPDQK